MNMPNLQDEMIIKVVNGMDQIPAEQWDACAGNDNPTVSHAFLSAMEDSGSVGGETGWIPKHLVLYDTEERVIGAVPLYLKGHSYGEYVFDWGWADAYERAGGRYYPKLQSSVPFTPVGGPRLLLRPDAGPQMKDTLITGLIEVCEQFGVSSLHVTFPSETEWESFGNHGFLQRTGEQFHWLNNNYQTFDDFLSHLSSRKRKNIRKEREKVVQYGLEFKHLSGDDLTEEAWNAFYDFYCDTSDKKWGQTYLTREFFSLISERMADRIVLIMAFENGLPVAGALNLLGRDALYGRNWGCLEDHKFLHFECCYYQAIDYAIEHGLSSVEAGAQGPHKLQRGYLPMRTYSAHWIRDPGLRDAIENYLRSERQHIDDEIEILTERSPFKNSTPDV